MYTVDLMSASVEERRLFATLMTAEASVGEAQVTSRGAVRRAVPPPRPPPRRVHDTAVEVRWSSLEKMCATIASSCPSTLMPVTDDILASDSPFTHLVNDRCHILHWGQYWRSSCTTSRRSLSTCGSLELSDCRVRGVERSFKRSNTVHGRNERAF